MTDVATDERSVSWLSLDLLTDHPDQPRKKLGDLSGLVRSIKAVGILEPLVVVPPLDGDGRYPVIAGRRRRAAAAKAGYEPVPVFIRPDLADKPAALAAALVENEHRDALTVAERIEAYRQLGLTGMSPAQIAKATGHKADTIAPVLAAAGSQRVADVLDRRPDALTLEQAAAVAEFDDDPETVDALVATAAQGEWRFTHAVDDARRLASIRKELTAKGWASERIVERTSAPVTARPIETLADDKGTLTKARHKKCPGRLAVVFMDGSWEEFCDSPEAQGHRPASPRRGPASRAAGDGRREPGAGMTEEQKAERRTVVANNKAWPLATGHRRRFLAATVAGRALTPDALFRWCLAEIGRYFPDRPNDEILDGILSVETSSYGYAYRRSSLAAVMEQNVGSARLPLLLFAVIAASWESRLEEKDTWRRVPADLHRYFDELVALGYGLSDIEQEARDAAAVKTEREAAWRSERKEWDASDAAESGEGAEGGEGAGLVALDEDEEFAAGPDYPDPDED